jgi:hypothetical protein
LCLPCFRVETGIAAQQQDGQVVFQPYPEHSRQRRVAGKYKRKTAALARTDEKEAAIMAQYSNPPNLNAAIHSEVKQLDASESNDGVPQNMLSNPDAFAKFLQKIEADVWPVQFADAKRFTIAGQTPTGAVPIPEWITNERDILQKVPKFAVRYDCKSAHAYLLHGFRLLATLHSKILTHLSTTKPKPSNLLMCTRAFLF